MSWAVLWFATTRDALGVDWKILTLASIWRQLEKYLWPEIHKWAHRLNWPKIGRAPFNDRELMQLSLKLGSGEAFAVASDNPETIEGAHADYILYIFDESKIIPEATWDSAEGAFASGIETYWLAASTPGEPQGRFYQIQMRVKGYEDWYAKHVTLEEAISSGRINPEWVSSRKRQWGENSAVFQNRVLGEFAESSTDGVIPLSWVEQAQARYYDQVKGLLPAPTALAVDVGRGGDPSTLSTRKGSIIEPVTKIDIPDTMQLVGAVVAQLLSLGKQLPVIVDIIGLGAGVYDRLQEQGFNVMPFIANEKTEWQARSGNFAFADTRSAAWWNARELLDPMNGFNMALPPDDDDLLVGDLTAPTWKYMSDGKIKLEQKDALRDRLGRSTDYGDVVVMNLWLEGALTQAKWEDLQNLGHVEEYHNPWE